MHLRIHLFEQENHLNQTIMASVSILIFGGVSEDNKIMMTKWGISSVHLKILGLAVDGRNPVKPCK